MSMREKPMRYACRTARATLDCLELLFNGLLKLVYNNNKRKAADKLEGRIRLWKKQRLI